MSGRPDVETGASFAPGVARRDQVLYHARRWDAVAECACHCLAGVKRYLEADLVVQHERADRETEGRHGLVHVLHTRAFAEQEGGFVQHDSQHARRVKARCVADDYHRLAHLCARGHGGLDGPLRGRIRTDDFEQRHALGR